jgi:hypothetical protein
LGWKIKKSWDGESFTGEVIEMYLKNHNVVYHVDYYLDNVVEDYYLEEIVALLDAMVVDNGRFYFA